MSWILQTYPGLNRRRALAHQLNLFREAKGPEGLAAMDPRHAAGLLESLASNVATVSMDLVALHETYYFREVEQRDSLPATVDYVQQLASQAQRSERRELQFASRMLHAPWTSLRTSSAVNSATRGNLLMCSAGTSCITGTGARRNKARERGSRGPAPPVAAAAYSTRTFMLHVTGPCQGSPVTTSSTAGPDATARHRTVPGAPIGLITRPSVPTTQSCSIPTSSRDVPALR
ncbi:hypothetical protein FBY31_3836 [Arthrobacter sp. SLBN-100]|nr:hypothetical protein FBY31_3836 [Arthrobacter sp. SLBN-100]